jgi:hypothetical protein
MLLVGRRGLVGFFADLARAGWPILVPLMGKDGGLRRPLYSLIPAAGSPEPRACCRASSAFSCALGALIERVYGDALEKR